MGQSPCTAASRHSDPSTAVQKQLLHSPFFFAVHTSAYSTYAGAHDLVKETRDLKQKLKTLT